MALSVWQKVVTSNTGVAVPNAQVEVFIGDTVSKPDLFQDADGTTPLTNPFDADANGFAQFYVEGGTYRIEASAEGADAVFSDVQLGTAQSLDVGDVVAPGDLATVATTGDHTDLSNIGTNTHAQIDTHIASTANPHSVTKTQIGLSNVDNVSAASLRDRTTHTGVQAISTVTNLQTTLDAKANSADLGAAATSNSHTDLDDIGTNTHAQIDTHIAEETAGVHGSTVAATANKLIHRDANGRAKIADPSVDADIASKGYVDTVIGAGITVKNSIEVDGGSAQLVNDETTPNKFDIYGTLTAKGWAPGIQYIDASAGCFFPDADVTLTGVEEKTIFTAANTSGVGGNRGILIDNVTAGNDFVTATTGKAGTFICHLYIDKTGAGDIDITLETGSGGVPFSIPALRLSGVRTYNLSIPVTFNPVIGGIKFTATNVSGSSSITTLSYISVYRISGENLL